ncbi:relaxase/mobilization nuclease domain-containing protein, partial [Proteus mirabilis]|uniref:relaxase/mobilization nuclease domain-containing protein n=1 Tax=Proteus mirabilis TaxID=584 RepID=UPI00217DD94E
LHNHIIINAVDLETGKKYHHHNDFDRVKKVNDTICKEHHLEIIQPKKPHEKRTSAEIQMKRRGNSPWKDEVRKKIDSVMSDSSISSYKAFRERLKEKGVFVHDRGKNVTYELSEGNKRVRGSKLGSSYEKSTLTQEFSAREKRATYKQAISNKTIGKRRFASSKNRYEDNLARFKESMCVDFELKLMERKGAMPRMNKDYFKTHKFKTKKPLPNISPVTFTRVITKAVEPTRSLGKSLSL